MRPRNQSIAYTEFLYVSLALILLIVLICLIMCGLKRLCHKKVSVSGEWTASSDELVLCDEDNCPIFPDHYNYLLNYVK
jgi:hypothetical protein